MVHVCHGDVWACPECCDDEDAGRGKCQRFLARERGGTRLVNRRHVPDGWGEPGLWPVDGPVVDIGRAAGFSHMVNTDPGDPGWLGNPFRTESAGGDLTREESVMKFREVFYRLTAQNPEFRDAVMDLRGGVLRGWCFPKLCHGDVILEYLDLHG